MSNKERKLMKKNKGKKKCNAANEKNRIFSEKIQKNKIT